MYFHNSHFKHFSFSGERMNFDIKYKEYHFMCDSINANSTYNALHKIMKEENANVYLGFCRNNLLAHQLFNVVFPALEETVLIAAPKLKQGRDWQFVTQFFTTSNWVLSLLVLLVTAFAFRHFAKTAGESDKKYRTLSECLLFIYSCFFNMGNNILPKDIKLRIICLSLGPFALNISAYLQGKLFGALTHPIYIERDQSTIAKLPVIIQEHMLTLFANSKSFNFIKSNRMSMEYDLQDVVRFEETATIITQQILQNYPHFIPYIQTHEIAKYQIVVYVMRHECFYEIINHVTKKLAEHGFIKKIISDIKYDHMLHCLKYMSCWYGRMNVSKLTSVDLRGAFFVLNLGFAIGLLTFITEIFCWYIKCKYFVKQ